MRERTVAINIRVTENEKRKMVRNANLCGLSLSEYLRKVGLGKEVRALPPERLMAVYSQVKMMKSRWRSLPADTMNRAFEALEASVLDAYHDLENRESEGETSWQ